MNIEEIEQEAKKAGLTPAEYVKTLTKEAPAAAPAPAQLRMQYVFVTLADGRRGAFCGPELIGKAELLLKPPVLQDIVFSEPKEYVPPTPEEVKETPSADPKIEDKPSDVGEKA